MFKTIDLVIAAVAPMFKTIGLVIAAVALIIALLVIETFFVMLFVGIAHSYDQRIPAFGFEPIFWLMAAIGIIIQGNTHDNFSRN